MGYFAFVIFVVANMFVWPLLGLESRMLRYGELPGYTYSDFFGRQPFATAIWWFAVYWGLLAAVLGIVTILLWPRGRERGVDQRFKIATPRLRGGLRLAILKR